MKAVVALGANIGNPEEQLNLAVAMLRESTDLLSVSSFYLTKAVGGQTSPIISTLFVFLSLNFQLWSFSHFCMELRRA